MDRKSSKNREGMEKYQNLRLFSFLVVGLDLNSVELALFLGGTLAGLECLLICSYVGKYSGIIEKKTECCINPPHCGRLPFFIYGAVRKLS